MMDYLNRDHSALHSEALRSYAADELLKSALRCSRSFRIQFDATRLERVIGKQMLSRLMPNLSLAVSRGRWTYDEYEDYLDDEKIDILRRILSLTPQGFAERPLNYIKSIRLLDQEGGTVLHGGDNNTFILFSLPKSERAALVEAYRQRGIPAEVIEQVDVDVEKLTP